MRRFLTTLCLSLVLLSTSCTKMFRDELNEIHTEIDDIKSRLDSICNAMNNNIASLKSIVTAMQNNDYVKSITPIIENGKEVGYEIVFTQSGKITIYHGKDGAAGDGTDGKDGHTPVIGVKQDVDGKWYWTVDGTWLLDSNGNKVKAVGEDGKDGQDGEDGKDGQDGEDGNDGQDGEDGKDGQNGEDGKDGQDGEDGKDGEDGEDGEDGVTPRLKIVDGYWYVSYDNGETWEPEPLGPATGASGSNGDAFFKDVDYNDESITLILADGTSLTIPTQKAHDALEARLSKLEVNVSSLQAIITAIQDNDYVKSVTPILENGVEVGYEIEFTKSGKIQIYHGESGEDGVTPELPVLTVKMHEEYGLCWWYGDDYVKDPETGKPVRAEAQDGRIPEFRIDEYGDWYVSYDGIHFQYVGQATGDSFFKSVNEIYAVGEDGKELVDAFGQKIVAYIEIVIFLDKKGNTATYRLPTEYTLNELAQRVDALEAQFKSLDALVNSLTNAEYIKEIVEIYGNTPQVIGYELTLVSLVVENGKFVEKITKKEILLAPTSGAVGIKYDGKTRTYYWTINGKELKDDKGNLIPASGPEKIIPEVKVEKNEWYFSVDGGKTWIATGISADGAGKPCIDAVEGDNDSDYFKFWLSDGTYISVPSWKAFENLQKEVTAIKNDINTFNTLLSKQAFVSKVEKDDKTGVVTVYYKSYDNEKGTWTETKGITFQEFTGVETFTKNGVEYWKIGGIETDIRVGHFTPEFVISGGKLYMSLVEKPGNDYTNAKEWKEIGNVGDLGGKTLTGISEDKQTGKITFTFSNGDVLVVPSWDWFNKAIAGIQADITAISTFVQGGKYITDVTEKDGVITIKYRTYDAAVKQWSEEKTEILNKDSYVSTYTENGVQYWLIAGVKTGIKVEHTHVPAITVNADGEICVDGKALGHLTNGKHVTDVKTEGEKITFTFHNGTTVAVPTFEAFQRLQQTVTAIQDDIAALQTFVQGGKYITDITEANGTITIKYREYDAQTKKWGEEKTETLNKDSYVSTYVENNVQYWLIAGVKTGIKVEHTHVPAITVNENGEICVDGKALGHLTDGNHVTEVKTEGDKITFTFHNGASVAVPTYAAFVALLERVAGIEGDIAALQTFVQGGKYITDITEANGTITIKYREYDAQTKKWGEEKTETLNKDSYVSTYVENNVQYWLIAGVKTGIKVEHTHVPAITVNENGEICVDGKALGHLTDGNHVTEVKTEGDKITFTFHNGASVAVPTYAAFVALLERVAGIESDIKALQTFVQPGRYITAVTEKDGVITISYRQYDAVSGWSEEKTEVLNKDSYVSTYVENDVQYWLIAGVKTGIKVEHTHVPAITVNENGEICVDGTALGYLTDGAHVTGVVTTDNKITITFHNGASIDVPTYAAFVALQETVTGIQNDIKVLQTFVQDGKYITDVTEKDGVITIKYRTYDAANKMWTTEQTQVLNQNSYVSTYTENGVQYWLIAGQKTGIKVEHTHVPAITVNADGQICVDGKPLEGHLTDGNHVTEVKTEGDKITFSFFNGTFVEVPTYAAFVALLDRVAGIEGDIAALQTFVQGGQYVTDVTESNGVITIKYREYDAQTQQWSTEQTKTLNADSYVSTYTENGVLYWLIAGQETDIKVDHTFVPEVKIEGGKLYVSTPDGGWREIGAVDRTDYVYNITEADGMVTITYGDDQSISVPTWAKFQELQEAVAKIEGDIEALQTFVQGGQYVTDVTESNGVITIKYREYDAQTQQWSTEQTKTLNADSYVSTYTENGVLYWLIAGQETDIKVDHTFVPEVKIEGGKLYVSTPDGGWREIGAVDRTDYVYNITEADGMVTITYGDGQSISVPTWAKFQELQEAVTNMKTDLEALNALFAGDNKFVTDVKDENGKLIVYYVTRGANGWTSSSEAVFNLNSYISVQDGYWVINGVKTEYKVEHPHIPEITVNDKGEICVDGTALGYLTGGKHVINVTTDDVKVTFTFADGTSVVLPMYTELAITGLKSRYLLNSNTQTIEFGYTGVKNGDTPQVFTICENGWSTDTPKVNDGKVTMKVTAPAGDAPQGKVLVFLSYNGKVVMAQAVLIYLKEGDIETSGNITGSNDTYNNGTFHLEWYSRGSFTVTASSDYDLEGAAVEFEYVTAQNWLGTTPITRSVESFEIYSDYNTSDALRKAIVKITLDGTPIAVFNVEQEGRINLSEDETANSYIVAKANDDNQVAYAFKATKGFNGDVVSSGTVSKTGNNISPHPTVVEIGGDVWISFDISDWNESNRYISMNGWKWHIWCTGAKPVGDTGILDRNLGATSTTDKGLTYYWGYPIDNSNYVAGAGEWAADKKTASDPCPAGYKVIGNDRLEGATQQNSQQNNPSYIHNGVTYPANAGNVAGWTSWNSATTDYWMSNKTVFKLTHNRTSSGIFSYNYNLTPSVVNPGDNQTGYVRCVIK